MYSSFNNLRFELFVRVNNEEGYAANAYNRFII